MKSYMHINSGILDLKLVETFNMKVWIIVSLCFAVVAAVPSRIIGGSVTTISNYPHVAALLFSNTNTGHRQSCAGTIINNRSILTAAHCTWNSAVGRWRTRVGSTNANSGGTVLNSAQFFNHPNYNGVSEDHDISIIRLASAITFSTLVRQADIASSTYNLADNQVVWAAGWGLTANFGSPSEQLRHVQVWTINQNICRQRFAQGGYTVTANMLCSGWLDVGGRDQCNGDSGGPLYHNGVVVGVCSWGYPRRCADSFYPGVNARVSRYTTWIQNNA